MEASSVIDEIRLWRNRQKLFSCFSAVRDFDLEFVSFTENIDNSKGVHLTRVFLFPRNWKEIDHVNRSLWWRKHWETDGFRKSTLWVFINTSFKHVFFTFNDTLIELLKWHKSNLNGQSQNHSVKRWSTDQTMQNLY